MAIFGATHAMARRLGVEVESFSMVIEDFRFRASRWSRRHAWTPQQFRGATYIDGHDNARDSFSNALQPTATCDARLSLVLHLVGSPEVEIHALENFLRAGRIAGGQIRSFGKIETLSSREDAEKSLSGFCLVDRADWMATKKKQGGNSLDALADLLQTKRIVGGEQKKGEEMLLDSQSMRDPEAMEKAVRLMGKGGWIKKAYPWMTATCCGYKAAYAPKKNVPGSREDLPHAYGEPLVGLAQWIPVSAARRLGEIPAWKYRQEGERFWVEGIHSKEIASKDWPKEWKGRLEKAAEDGNQEEEEDLILWM